jgi:hypothetical protein
MRQICEGNARAIARQEAESARIQRECDGIAAATERAEATP